MKENLTEYFHVKGMELYVAFDDALPTENETEWRIRLSIAKWQAIVDWYKTHRRGIVDDGQSNTCALCWKWNTFLDSELSCVGCPVYKETGQPCCRGTHFVEYIAESCNRNRYLVIEAAEKELKFLQGLLEKLLEEKDA